MTTTETISFASEQLLRDAYHICFSTAARNKIDSLLHFYGKRTESRARRPLALPLKGEK